MVHMVCPLISCSSVTIVCRKFAYSNLYCRLVLRVVFGVLNCTRVVSKGGLNRSSCISLWFVNSSFLIRAHGCRTFAFSYLYLYGYGGIIFIIINWVIPSAVMVVYSVLLVRTLTQLDSIKRTEDAIEYHAVRMPHGLVI